MKILVDMNLTPEWVSVLLAAGLETRHWADVGDPRSSDEAILRFALEEGYVVFTHDLDFGDILAATNARGPSVVQIRTQNPTPQAMGPIVLKILHEQRSHLLRGALVTIEPARQRTRILPLFRDVQ